MILRLIHQFDVFLPDIDVPNGSKNEHKSTAPGL